MASLHHGCKPDGRSSLIVHLAAFAALTHRYRGEDEARLRIDLAVEPSSDGPAVPARSFAVTIPLHDDPTVEVLLTRSADALASAGYADPPADRPVHVRITWAGADVSAATPESGETLTLSLDIPATGAPTAGEPASPEGLRRPGPTAKLSHHDRLCPNTTPELMDGHFRLLLEGVAKLPATSVGRLPMLAEPEVRTILDEWSGPAHDPDMCRDELLHELFEAQADARSDAPALECADARMTYAQLERRANQLAWHLRSRGAGPGQFVGIHLPRSAEAIVALLAILKSGAAYVPIDADYPADRVRYIMADCGLHTLITVSSLATGLEPGDRPVVLMDRDGDAIAAQPDRRLTRADTAATPDNACYVIYTSGSTGRPKGVPVTHRSACNLVRAEGRIFGVGCADRVYQGFSIAFDASVEEVWLALFSGSTLVVGTHQMVHAGPALAGLLSAAGITVFSTVPTMLAMLEDDIPTLRLLILGGEACPQDLVRRWCRQGLRMVNTYGPTEATVIATYTDCAPDRPITIGRAAPNYRTYILNPHLQPVPVGVCGELHLGGVGVAAGYLGRPELTAQRFVANPFCGGEYGRLYKTGDLVRHNLSGEIEFVGRLDTQVKLRGFRIELSEIENVLLRCPAIQAAVVSVREDTPGVQQLVGYVVPAQGQSIDEDAVRAEIRKQLPPFMVPAILEPLAELPTLASGKVDRQRLPAPRPRRAAPAEETEEFASDLERQLAVAWRELFAPATVGLDADFFTDLGGHSLLAARMVSRLRQQPDFAGLSVLDVYNFPTVRSLAAELTARRKTPAGHAAAPAAPSIKPTSPMGYRLCALAQTLCLWLIAGLFSAQWLTPYLVYCWMTDRGSGIIDAIVVSLAALLAFYPLLTAASIAIKWLVIGRYKPGVHAIWGWYYLRWWLVNQVLSVVPIDYLAGTPLLSWYYRAMGARVGRNVFFGSDNVSAFDLVSVGDDSSLGIETMLMGYTLEGGLLHLGPVSVGRRCFVGARSVVRPNTVMEDDARLEDLSLLSEGARIPRGQTWIGSPARPIWPAARPEPAPADTPSPLRRALCAFAHALGVLLVPAASLIALFPGLIWLNYVTRTYDGYEFLLLAPVVALAFVVLMAMQIVLVKWLLLGRVRPGTYSVYSWFYIRKWFVDQLMDLSLDLLGPLYATLYLAPWLRLLGAKLGHRAEISTASATCPDLLSIDDESFIADAVCLGAHRVEGGRITIAPTRVGKRAFVGNSAYVPSGAVIGDDVLIGCMSASPLSAADAARPGTSWLGSPSFFLPQRQESAAFSAEQTFRPSRRLVALRAFIEFFRITLPITFFVALTSTLITVVINLQYYHLTTLELVIVFPVLYLAFGVAAALIVVACKWILMGRYRPTEKPLWSSFVWRTELLTAMHEHLADPFLVMLLLGTPWVNWFFRLLGSKVGRRVCMETTCLTEFDMIAIGDRATLGSECTIQTHLFEDRVMKVSTIDIGADCTVGAGSIVLYDTRMEDGSSLGDLSLLMKGENLPAGTQWEGAPARLRATGSDAVDATPNSAPLGPSTPSEPVAPAVNFFFGLNGHEPGRAGPCVWVFDLNDARRAGAKPPAAAAGGEAPARDSDHALGRQLARQIVGRHLNLRPEDVAFDVGTQGELRVAADKMPAGSRADKLRLSVAHSQSILAAGVSFDGPIGVDVEVMRADLDLDALAGECLTAAERQRLLERPAEQRSADFHKLWTAKEAFVKAIGQGVFFGLREVEMAIADDGSVRLTSLNGQTELARGWTIVHRAATVGGLPAMVAVATGE